MFGRPSRPKDRTQPTKLELDLDMHSIGGGTSSKSAVRACVPSVFDQPSRSAPYSGCRAA